MEERKKSPGISQNPQVQTAGTWGTRGTQSCSGGGIPVIEIDFIS